MLHCIDWLIKMQIQQGFSSFFSPKFCQIWWFFREEYCETLKKSSNMGKRNKEKHCSMLFQFWVCTIKPDFGHIHLLARSFTIQRTKPHYFYDLKKALTSQPNLKLGSEIILRDIVLLKIFSYTLSYTKYIQTNLNRHIYTSYSKL